MSSRSHTPSTSTSLNISLPASLKTFIEKQVAQRGYTSASEYIRELVRAAQEAIAKEELEAKLLAGLNSPMAEVTPEDWAEVRAEVLRRIERRKEQSTG